MKNFELPILEDNGEIKHKTISVDYSLYSQIRWEENFPKLAEREGLFEYITRMSQVENVSPIVLIISNLKALYCFMDVDFSWDYFLKMFKIDNREYLTQLCETISKIFHSILDGSAEKN